MSTLFNEISELLDINKEDEILEISNNNDIRVFKNYIAEKIKNDKFFSNIIDYNIDNNEVTLYFKTEFSDNFSFNTIILPVNYLIEPLKPINNICYKEPRGFFVSGQEEKDYSVNLVLYSPHINNVQYTLTENDINSFKALNETDNIKNILIYMSFDSIETYKKFIKLIYDKFHIYPHIYFLSEIKKKTQIKYKNFPLFISDNPELYEDIIFDKNIHLSYENKGSYNFFWINYEQ